MCRHKKTPSVIGAFLYIIQRGGVKRVLSGKRSPKRFKVYMQTLSAECIGTTIAEKVAFVIKNVL